MFQSSKTVLTDKYLAPECDVLSLAGGAAVCQTSVGGDLESGRGIDWGTFGA